MKRRNADTGKLRRPIKRTKITEGMYGNSMLYLKFIMVWTSVVLADYMLEFRFEFLWPFWMMLRSVYDSYKYQGLAFSVFFICIALTSDMICFFFIPVQYIFFAASTYVWVQYVWYTFADKGICLPTVAICCLIVYIEGIRGAWVSTGSGHAWGARPLAAHCVGYPAVTLGVGVKRYVVRRLRLRTQRLVRAQNEFYFALMRDALPPSEAVCECPTSCPSARHMGHMGNGSVGGGGGGGKRRNKLEPNGHCVTDTHNKSEHTEGVEKKTTRERDKCAQNHIQTNHASSNSNSNHTSSSNGNHTSNSNGNHTSNSNGNHTSNSTGNQSSNSNGNHTSNSTGNQSSNSNGNHTSHSHTNGSVLGPGCHDDEKQNHCKTSTKSSKYDKKETTSREEKKDERRKHKKDKDRENSDSHKSTEHTKEHIFKEVESTKENVRSKDSNNSSKEKDKERGRERDRELKDREKERERERERERELREARECASELKRVKQELSEAQRSEAEARRALSAAAAADRLRRADHAQLKLAHAALQNKVSTWRCGERAALERRLGEERRARSLAEHQLHNARNAGTGECENSWCSSRVRALESEAAALRRELARARDAAALAQRDCARASDVVRSLESRFESSTNGPTLARATQLERALSAETRVKLDLLAALGEANRKMHIQDSVINRQEKELEELKAQMLAVMPADFVTPVSTSSKLLSDASPLDPNATVYTPKQLCSDA